MTVFPAFERSTLIRFASLVALAAVTAAAWFALVQSHRTPPASDYVSPSTLTPPTPSPAPEETEEPIVVAFLGDSYTAGTGAGEGNDNWVTSLSEEQSWEAINFGVGGTGYVAAPFVDGEQRSPYSDRVEAVVAVQPDVVIVSGGRNDLGQTPGVVGEAAADVFTQLRAGLPNASIITLAPWWDATEPPFELSLIANAIESAAEDAGVTYLDTGSPLNSPDLLAADGIHPNAAGHAAIAEAVGRALESIDF